MKRLAIISLVVLCLASVGCGKDQLDPSATASVRVMVNDFTVSQEDLPSKDAQDIADYSGVKAITLAFYNGSTEVYKVTQLRDDNTTYTTFGEFSLSLPMGGYTMVVLGYALKDGEPAITLTSPTSATFGEYPARETFAATQAVSITNTDAVDISATLNRIVSKLQVASSDGRTIEALRVRMTFSAGGKSFNPTTGLATDNSGFSNTVTTSTAVGATSLSNSIIFLTSDEQTMNVTIETLDGNDNVLFSKVVENVPFKRNRLTRLTGAIYTNSSVGGGFQVETDWLPTYDGTF